MKQLNKSEQPSKLSPQLIISDVYSIIDSRIQYIEYQAHCRLRNSIKNSVAPGKNNKDYTNDSTSEMLASNFDEMLTFVSSLETPLKLLQILKTWLRNDNLALVMSLLYNNTYLKYSEEHLEKMLKEEEIGVLA